MTDETKEPAKDHPSQVVARLIASNAAGEATGYATEDLNHVYLDLSRGAVCQKSDALLKKIIGEDWATGFENDGEDEGGEYDADLDQSVAETIEAVLLSEAISGPESLDALSTALMLMARELGWIETSRAAHELWFRVSEAVD